MKIAVQSSRMTRETTCFKYRNSPVSIRSTSIRTNAGSNQPRLATRSGSRVQRISSRISECSWKYSSGQVEGVLAALHVLGREPAAAELALDPLVAQAAHLRAVGEPEGLLDHAVVEEGAAQLERVRHGVLVLAQQQVVLEPVVELEREQAVEEAPPLLARRGAARPQPACCAQRRRVELAALVLVPERLQRT